jgi:Zn-dependent membrane protease YugP
MNLNITDPAFLFPGISLLFLAYTNRYLALASVIRTLNTLAGDTLDENREQQISSLHLRIQLIKFMQASGVVAFLLCVLSMLALIWNQQTTGEVLFVSSLIFMIISLLLSLTEVLKSGQSLKIELNRTHKK